MERRDFLKKGLSIGFVAGAAFTLNPYKLAASHSSSSYDMVAIRGGEADSMFDRAMEEYGGMRSIIRKGQSVVIKPNIGWDKEPEIGANTNPALVGRIVEHCKAAGAGDVYVFDHTCNEWSRCYKNSGIESAVKKAGGKMVMGNSEKYYHEVEIPDGKVLKKDKVHELILESDVFINVPVLKHHGGAQITSAMKNLMGIIWDRGYWHRNDLHQCIADFSDWRTPDLTIVDAYRVIKRNGPQGVTENDSVLLKSQLIGKDMVALDTAAIKLFGMDPEDVDYVALAEAGGAGSTRLNNMNIARIKV